MDPKNTEEGARVKLLSLLTELEPEEFKDFKLHLEMYPLTDEKLRIPCNDLQKAERIKTADLMISHYQEHNALQITEEIMLKLNMHKISYQHSSYTPYEEKYKEYIKDKFSKMIDKYSLTGKHVTLEEEYKKLKIVKYYYYSKYPNSIFCHSMEKGLNFRTTIQTIFIPERRTSPICNTVVLLGEAGIGKTTTARKIMLDWASGELFQDTFNYVFYVQCSELALQWKKPTIKDLILHSCGGKPLISMSKIESDPSKLLFLIDGLDELPDKSGMCETVIHLIREQFPNSYIIIASRLSDRYGLTQSLKMVDGAACYAEILGFSEHVTMDYFSMFFENKIQSEYAFNIVKESAFLLNKCSVPTICRIVCTVIKQQMEKKDFVNSFRTMTSIYMLFLSNGLKKDCSDSVHPTNLMQIKQLCFLAREGIDKKIVLFNESDLIMHGVDVPGLQSLFPCNNIFQKGDESNLYSFLHLSVQEFFAALFYVLGGNEEVHEHIRTSPNVMNLLIGFRRPYYHNKWKLTMHFLFGLLSQEIVGQMQTTFQCKISSDIKSVLQRWINEEIKLHNGKLDDLELIHYLYETQDEEFTRNATSYLKTMKIHGMSNWKRKPVMDLRELGFCLKNSLGVQEIHLSDFEIKPDTLSALLPGLMKCFSLTMKNCTLTDKCCADLSFVLKTSLFLINLNLSNNKLMDSGVKELCEGLNHPGCKIQALAMENCTLTDKCCADLSPVLKRSLFLINLNLSNNKLMDSGVKELCEGLNHPGCKLQALTMENCTLTDKCCAALSSVLKRNPFLINLNLSNNKLMDSGVEELCEGLKDPGCKLQALNMKRCSLTGSCCANLYSALKRNTSLTDLNLSNNKLEDSGVRELCKGLKLIGCKIQTLKLQSTDLTDDSTEALCLALSTKLSLQHLDLWQNSFTARSAASFHTLKETIPNLNHQTLASPMPLTNETYMKNENAHYYKATFSEYGTFICSNTGLCFEVNRAGSIEYGILPWDHHLTECAKQEWMVAGPLFEIKADPGLVETMYLPHFVLLNSGNVDISQIKIAHFQANEKMTKEKASLVQPFHVVLKGPSFSLRGALWQFKKSLRKPFPARACALLYQLQNSADVNTTLHLHLIPNEKLLIKELDNSTGCDYKKIEKSACIPTALYFDSTYTVESDPGSAIRPKDLRFMYRCPGEAPYYSEIYIKNDLQMKEMVISIITKKDRQLVWDAEVRPADIAHCVQQMSIALGAVNQEAVSALSSSPKIVICDVLMNLKEEQFRKLKFLLEDYDMGGGKSKIPKAKVEKAEHTEIADLMISHCGDQLALQVTQDLLEKIPRQDLLEEFNIASQPFLEVGPAKKFGN